MNTNTKNSIVLYADKKGNIELRANADKDTVWATQEQIARLFDIERSVVTKHIHNILKNKELDVDSVCAKFAHTAKDGKNYLTNCYNLDVTLAVGYRTNSSSAIKFRQWASRVLREYMLNGYSINRYKLEDSTERLEGLHETMALLESKKYRGKVKGKLTLKLSKDMEEI